MIITKPKLYNRHHKDVPPTAVYIGRGTVWGNPFLIGTHGNREQVVAKYHEWITERPAFVRQIKKQLKGRDLVCSCTPALCHGVILLAIANS